MNAMTPRDIQLRIRSGDSLADVIAASGMPADRVEAFAAPILAERDHATFTALSSPVRRRGETASVRRLRQTVAESLLDRGQDIDFVTWDSWRRSDGRWIVQGTWQDRGHDESARFLYDTKGHFSVAENDQARSLIGDLPRFPVNDTGNETTLQSEPSPNLAHSNLADETTLGLRGTTDDDEDSLRSDIDLLYDMISTIDEDSVRIFRGLREPLPDPDPDPADLSQPSLIETETAADSSATDRPRRGRRRASVPSWDEIIFGGQS